MSARTPNTRIASKNTTGSNGIRTANMAQEEPLNPEWFNEFIEDMAKKMVTEHLDECKAYKEAIEGWLDEKNNFEVDIENELEAGETSKHLRRAMKQLSEYEKKIINLYFYENLRLSDIAEVLGISQDEVNNMKAMALKKLQLSLK